MAPRHVLFVTIDTLRADHLSCLGYPRPTTPKLDNLARSEGLLFPQAYAQAPHTAGSVPSFMTSTYPLMYGGEGRIDTKGLTIAECLKTQGFVTAGIHSNPFLSRAYGHDKGFDFFDDNFLFGVAKPLIFFHRALNYFRYEPYLTGKEMNHKALHWLWNQGLSVHQQGGRFFLWLHYMNVHGPYHPPAAYQRFFMQKAVSKRERHHLWKKMIHHAADLTAEERQTLVDLYDAEIRCMDDCFAELFDELDRMGLRKDSVIGVTADHGEEFGEHQGFFHLKQLYDEVLHVPLILFGEEFPKGRSIPDLVRLIDVAPTLFALLKVPQPPHFLGTSLVPLIDGSQSSLGLDVFCEVIGRRNGQKTRKFALRTPKSKYIAEYDADLKVVNQELYDLVSDPRETVNLTETWPQELQTLDRRLRSYMNLAGSLETPIEIPPEQQNPVDAEVESRLRDLGYLE